MASTSSNTLTMAASVDGQLGAVNKRGGKMTAAIDYSQLVSASIMNGEDDEETQQLNDLLRAASLFMLKRKFVKRILHVHFGFGIADKIGVFLFKIEPLTKNVEELLW